MSAMLLKRTRPQTTNFYWYDNSILKLASSWGAYGINRIGIDSFFAPIPSSDFQSATRLHMTEETSLAQVDHISFLQVDKVSPKRSIADVSGVFNNAQLDEPNTLSKSSTYHARSMIRNSELEEGRRA